MLFTYPPKSIGYYSGIHSVLDTRISVMNDRIFDFRESTLAAKQVLSVIRWKEMT